jgi:long-chain acyl-CoA synthetase
MLKSVLAAVRRTPMDQPALGDGVRQVSFGDLDQMIEQERRWLESYVVRDCALVAENSCGWVISDLALLASDAATVAIPVNFTAEQISHALHDAAVEFVLTDARRRTCAERAGFLKVGLSNRTGLTLLHRRGCDAGTRAAYGVSKVSYRAHGMSAPQAMLLETATIKRVTDELLRVQRRVAVARHLSFLPLTSALENVAGVYVSLLLGAQVLLKTRAIAAMNCTPTGVETLLAALRQERPHSVALSAALLGTLLNAIDRGWRAPEELRSVVVDSDSATPELLQRARAAGLPVIECELLERAVEVAAEADSPKPAAPVRPFTAPDRNEGAYGAA